MTPISIVSLEVACKELYSFLEYFEEFGYILRLATPSNNQLLGWECMDQGSMVFLGDLTCVFGLYTFTSFPAVSLGQMKRKSASLDNLRTQLIWLLKAVKSKSIVPLRGQLSFCPHPSSVTATLPIIPLLWVSGHPESCLSTAVEPLAASSCSHGIQYLQSNGLQLPVS